MTRDVYHNSVSINNPKKDSKSMRTRVSFQVMLSGFIPHFPGLLGSRPGDCMYFENIMSAKSQVVNKHKDVVI